MSIKKLYLELTNRCNLNCSMCYRKAWHQETVDMSPEVLKRCLEQIDLLPSIKEIVLGGIGEPTFFPQVENVMHILKDKYITLTTNGTIMHESMVDTIVETVDNVVISMDGMSEVFYSIRQFSLDQIILNIKAINEAKKQRKSQTPLISFQMVISKTNKDEILQVIDLAASLNVSKVILSNIMPATKEDEALVLYTRYENEEIKKLFLRVQNHAEVRGVAVKRPEYQLKTERRCKSITEDATMVTASGDIVPCYRLAHESTEFVFGRGKEIIAHSFGNIIENSLKEIWDSSSYTSFRKTVIDNHYPSCIDCDLVDGCDMVRSTAFDCYGLMPSCADCLWSRGITYCV